MTLQHITDPLRPIGEILDGVGREGILLEDKDQTRYAVLPLDDELIDFLVERSPKFIAACREARDQMRAGKFRSHAEVRKLFDSD